MTGAAVDPLPQWVALLQQTPPLLSAWLRHLPAAWLDIDEGPDTWSARTIVGHLIEGERSDWLPRVRHLLQHGERLPFPPFDRFAQLQAAPQPIAVLLDAFAAAREQSLRELASLRLSAPDLARTGCHPEFGVVTLRQHLATWVAHDQTHILQVARVFGRSLHDDVGPWRAYLRVVRAP